MHLHANDAKRNVHDLGLLYCHAIYLLFSSTRDGICRKITILHIHALLYRGSYECSCFIEFIKQIEEKEKNVRLADHFISFSQQV